MPKRACRHCSDRIPYAMRQRRHCSDWCRDQAAGGRLATRKALAALLALIGDERASAALVVIDAGAFAAGRDALAATIASMRGGR